MTELALGIMGLLIVAVLVKTQKKEPVLTRMFCYRCGYTGIPVLKSDKKTCEICGSKNLEELA